MLSKGVDKIGAQEDRAFEEDHLGVPPGRAAD
jgi:hypothetical protein